MRPLRPAARSSANFSSMRLGMGRRIVRGAGWFDSENSCTTVRPRMSEAKPATLVISEIYQSIQGESTWAGLPCVFIRTTACDLRCSYCDTEYAFYEGKKRPLDEVIAATLAFDCPMVEVTGGEPLLQKNVLPLMSALCDAGKVVLLEPSGAHDISAVDS